MKWRGVLFLRFLLCLVDDSGKIRQLADFLFGNILKGKQLNNSSIVTLWKFVILVGLTFEFVFLPAKAPLLAYNSFIEAIYVLNDCHAHNGHNDSKNSRTESRLFSIRYLFPSFRCWKADFYNWDTYLWSICSVFFLYKFYTLQFPGVMMRGQGLNGCGSMCACWNKWHRSTFWLPLQSYVLRF